MNSNDVHPSKFTHMKLSQKGGIPQIIQIFVGFSLGSRENRKTMVYPPGHLSILLIFLMHHEFHIDPQRQGRVLLGDHGLAPEIPDAPWMEYFFTKKIVPIFMKQMCK